MPNWFSHEECTCEKQIGIGVVKCSTCFDDTDKVPTHSRSTGGHHQQVAKKVPYVSTLDRWKAPGQRASTASKWLAEWEGKNEVK